MNRILIFVIDLILVPILVFIISNTWAKISLGDLYIYDIKVFLFYYMAIIFFVNLISCIIFFRQIFNKRKYFILFIIFALLLIFNILNVEFSF